MERKTIVINLIGAPGTGKSTITSELFSKLKWMGVDSEIVSEYAKDLTWEKRSETLKNQRYIFGKQHHRLFRVNNQVDIIVTDCPLVLNLHYERVYGDKSKVFEQLVKDEISKFDNINIFLNRTKPYNPNGRNQTEAEANQFSLDIKGIISEIGMECIELDAYEHRSVFEICKILNVRGVISDEQLMRSFYVNRPCKYVLSVEALYPQGMNLNGYVIIPNIVTSVGVVCSVPNTLGMDFTISFEQVKKHLKFLL